MTTARLTILFLLLIALFRVAGASAQQSGEQRDPESRLEDLRKQIESEESRLASTEEKERASVEQLNSLNRQISIREELVKTYSLRISQLRKEQGELESSISQTDEELAALKAEYRSRATHAYKYGRQHDMALILSAESINQMLVRIGYLKRFSDRRSNQLDGIRTASRNLTQQRALLQRRLDQTEELLVQADQEQDRLASLKSDRQSEVSKLRTQKTELTESLQTKRSLERDLMDRIAALIAEEAADPGSPEVLPAPKFDGAAFEARKGLLPWPASGAVLEPFGEIVNPVYGTRTPNPGILIATSMSAEVKAVSEGRISTIDIMPDLGRYVIIDHGSFHTVYGNFSLLYVSEGDIVRTGQLIGRGGTSLEPRGEAVFFGLFQDGIPVDPQEWLQK